MHAWNDDRIFERAAWGLSQEGHDVTLIAPAESDLEVDGVKVKAIPIRSRIGKHIISPFEAFWKMKMINADIYHFFNPNMMWLMRRWAKKGKKVFIDIHENYEARVAALPLPAFVKPQLIKSYRFVENTLCNQFKGITVVTNSMKRKVESSLVPVLVVDNVPFLERLREIELAKKKEEHPVIITSGTHSKERNCMEAVEALPIIAASIPNVEMKFVGRFQPAEYEQDLHNRARELGVSKNFTTEGMLPWKENFSRISKAHIGCVFYNDNLNNRVTLPNRLYEYMYCNMAVLGEDFPEVKNVLDTSKAGLSVKSRSPEDIAQKSLKLLRDESLLRNCMSNARRAVEKKYNFETTLKELIKFYDSSITKS